MVRRKAGRRASGPAAIAQPIEPPPTPPVPEPVEPEPPAPSVQLPPLVESAAPPQSPVSSMDRARALRRIMVRHTDFIAGPAVAPVRPPAAAWRGSAATDERGETLDMPTVLPGARGGLTSGPASGSQTMSSSTEGLAANEAAIAPAPPEVAAAYTTDTTPVAPPRTRANLVPAFLLGVLVAGVAIGALVLLMRGPSPASPTSPRPPPPPIAIAGPAPTPPPVVVAATPSETPSTNSLASAEPAKHKARRHGPETPSNPAPQATAPIPAPPPTVTEQTPTVPPAPPPSQPVKKCTNVLFIHANCRIVAGSPAAKTPQAGSSAAPPSSEQPN